MFGTGTNTVTKQQNKHLPDDAGINLEEVALYI